MASPTKKNFKSFRIDDILQPEEYKGLDNDSHSDRENNNASTASPVYPNHHAIFQHHQRFSLAAFQGNYSIIS